MEKNLTEEEIRAIVRYEIEKAEAMTKESFQKALLGVIKDSDRIAGL